MAKKKTSEHSKSDTESKQEPDTIEIDVADESYILDKKNKPREQNQK